MAFCARTKFYAGINLYEKIGDFFSFLQTQSTTTTTTKAIATQYYVKIFMVILVTKIFALTKETNQNLLYIFLLPFPHCHMSLCPTSKYTTMTQKFVTNIELSNCLFGTEHFFNTVEIMH